MPSECRGLISRMLTTNPSERATLQEIMNHSWLTKGFNGPPENFLPARKPLQLPLDSSVIDKMTGFDFGAADVITAQLTKLIESESYQRAVRDAEKRSAQPTPELEQKRGVFNFYKRRNSINSRDTLNTPSSEAVQLGQDPVNAFHPLISIYYLAQEKQEREAREKNPGALSLPTEPGENPLKFPDLPTAPEAAYTNAHTHEMAGEKPTGGRSRPRARTHGEDEATEGLQNLNVSTAPNPTIVEPEQQAQQPARKESTVAGLLRRVSTRRHREPSDREREPREKVSHPPSSLAAYGTSETPRKSFSVRRTRERDPSATRPETSQGQKSEWLTPPTLGDGTASEKSPKKSHGLGRSISVNSSDVRRRLTRRNVSEGTAMRPPMTSSSSQDPRPSMEQGREEALTDVEESTNRPQGAFASRAKSLGHSRKESMQARRLRREAARTSGVPEETDAELQDEVEGDNADRASPTDMKPVYLKGLFSVSTTSSRPLTVIRGDIIRVLKQLGVEYREIKGGFSCRHSPSIMPQPPADETAPSGAQAIPSPSSNNSQQSHQRKISFGRLRNSDRDEFRNQPPPTPRNNKLPRDPSNTNSEEDSEEEPAMLSPKPTMSRPPGETSTHVQSDMGRNVDVKFEIFIVKVPLLSLHGIQFKKVDGGTWQYKNIAQTILNELRL